MARIERAQHARTQHAPTATRKRSWLTRSRDPQAALREKWIRTPFGKI